MNTPPLLLGSTLILWGWQSGLLWVAVLLAFILEGSRWVSYRWEFSQADLDRLWNLCGVLLMAAAVYAATSEDSGFLASDGSVARRAGTAAARVQQIGQSFKAFMQSLPLVLFPLVAAQAFSHNATFSYRSLAWVFRHRFPSPGPGAPEVEGGVNISYLYFVLCLLAASRANRPSAWFYSGFAVLIGWALWPSRSRRWSGWIWLCLIMLVSALGIVNQLGFIHLQKWIDQLDDRLIFQASGLDGDSTWSQTAIGSMKPLKLSGRILMRIEVEPPGPPPELLREAVYNQFKGSAWNLVDSTFHEVTPEGDATSWTLKGGTVGTIPPILITREFKSPQGLLALPLGTYQLSNLPVVELSTNPHGTVRISQGPGVLEFSAHYDPSAQFDREEDSYDLNISGSPRDEVEAIRKIARDWGL